MNIPAVILLHPNDTVVVCIRPIRAGEEIHFDNEMVVAIDDVETGHKIARQDAQKGDKVIKYGTPIGSFSSSIRQGTWVHRHNMKSDYIDSHTRDSGPEGAA